MKATGWLNASKRNGECPLCGHFDWCSFSEEKTAVLCRRTDIVPPGWKRIKPASDGIGYVYIQESESSVDFFKWQRELQLQRQQREREEANRKAKSLSAVERDRHFRKLLDQLPLAPSDRADLHRRGLSDEEIKLCGFKSVEVWQKLDLEVDHRLPGVSLDGRSLNIKPGDEGYLCPIKNEDGLIVGCQLRRRIKDNTGRYRWLTSATKKRPNGSTSHLPCSELPIAVHRPNELTSNIIGLCEGTGVKPFLAAIRLSQIVLGAASANFAASPTLTLAALEKISTELGTKKVVLYADAGSVHNRSVLRIYRNIYQLLRSKGFTLLVGWWEQINKDDCDIDELPADATIELITWSQFEEVAKNPNRIWENIKKLFGQLKNKFDKPFKGFGPPPVVKPKPLASVIEYVPDQLPTPLEYQALGCPKIVFSDRQRLQVWQEAVAKGWQHILDNSAPGQGKSHAVGIAQDEAFRVERLWYLSTNHRNPTTKPIESDFVDMVIRTSGMKRDTTRKTPLGHDWVVHPQKGEAADIPGNCHRAELFAVLKGRGIHNIEGKESPICASCHLLGACKGTKGPGFGFRSQRREILASPKIRAHPDSLPSTAEFDYSSSGLFWDETSTLIKPMDSVSVALADFDQTWAELEVLLPDIHSLPRVKEARLILRSFLTGDVCLDTGSKPPKYGWSDGAIRAHLPEPPSDLNELIAAIEEHWQPDLSFLKEQPDGVDVKSVPKEFRNAARVANDALRRESYKESWKELKELPLDWLVPFLKVWNGERGSLHCQFGKLTIFTRNSRHSELAAAAKFNIYLDATLPSERLAPSIDLPTSSILTVTQSQPSYRDLRIILVTGMGKLGKDRSESLTERVAALKAELPNRYEGIGIIDWKATANDYEGNWFVDNRGSNDFLTAPALASFGIPYINLGHLQALHHTLTGRFAFLDKNNPDPELQGFINAHIEAEIVQTCGRLRAHLRPDEQLTYIFVGDYPLDFLLDAFPDATIESVEAFSITPLAGTAVQQARWAILQAAKQVTEMGQKLTQNVIASITGFTQGRISQIAAELGGWRILKKILAVLLKSLYSGTNNLDEDGEFIDEGLESLAKDYLPAVIEQSPLQALKDVVELAVIYDSKEFWQTLAATSLDTKSKLLALLMPVLPQSVQQELAAIATETS